MQNEIINSLRVEKLELEETKLQQAKRLILETSTFLKKYLEKTPCKTYVLGLSGGVDSFVASMLVKQTGIPLVNVSLPYHTQHDIQDVCQSCAIIKPETFLMHNIGNSVDATMETIIQNKRFLNNEQLQLIKGNLMARERMNVQYAYAMAYDGLVLGTDHATEALIGFYTKFGDGAADIVPLATLTKDIIWKMAELFDAPSNILNKAPSAGLWEDQTDESELGIKYDDMIAYLQGKDIKSKVRKKIETRYVNTRHKRNMPITINDTWWEN